MSRAGPEPTTTSFAVLGLLAIRPASTYELAKLMDRSLSRVWPRATSKIYEEPKRLAALGYASATPERRGKRKRTVYTITPKGRKALARWLESPGAGPVLEFEQLLKVFFAENGTRQSLLAQLAAMREWASAQSREHVRVAREYLDGEGPFPERAAILILTGRFLWDFTQTIDAWAAWAATVVQRWPADPREARPDWAAIEPIARRGRRPVTRRGKAG